MRLIWMTAILVGAVATAEAHHPDRENQPVHRRIDVIGPLGNCLPPSYRRRYNRPTYLGGKIAYKIAPSSQEAMAWHAAEHRGDYQCDRGRVEMHYFYPKPYEALRIGPRRRPEAMENETKSEIEDREVTFDGPAVDPIDTEDALQNALDDGKVLDGADLLDDRDAMDDIDSLPRAPDFDDLD